MTKVAFWFDAPIEYSGGLNYIKNLLYALSLVNPGAVQPYVFFPTSVPDSVEREFSALATVVKTDLLKRRTLKWFVHRVCYRALGSMACATALLRSHGIEIVSHAWFVYSGRHPFRIISWIPDFQYLHLPELFPTIDPADETKRLQAIIAQSDANILSSYSALEDFKRIAPDKFVKRAKVIQFVSQPRSPSANSTLTLSALQSKYNFTEKYFYLPNQFWAHKNHIVVLQALKILKGEGIDLLVVCTGTLVDYRYKDTPYVDSIYAFITENNLQDNVRILGMIDYDEVLFLMKHTTAVLNPSKFEGWSSSVEEAKSAGKKILLSRIDVHLEQAPARGVYFDPDDARTLAHEMKNVWLHSNAEDELAATEAANRSLRERTKAYGAAYLKLIDDVMNERNTLA